MLGLTAALMGALWAFSVFSSPRSRGCRWARRIFWSFALLSVSGALGGVPFSFVNLAAAASLGLPGYAALWAIAAM